METNQVSLSEGKPMLLNPCTASIPSTTVTLFTVPLRTHQSGEGKASPGWVIVST